MSELILNVFTYGPNEKRVEIEMQPTIPENLRGNIPKMQEWAKNLIMVSCWDMKHTNNWLCEICSKLSRETKVQMASRIHFAQPRITLYIHHLCEAGTNPCHQIIVNQGVMMGAVARGGIPDRGLTEDQYIPKPDGVEYPLAASCCGCKDDNTAKRGVKMSRCGGCKLSRYYSTKCQSDDWKRHKKICKYVKSVKWVNWD
ncbi:hypothetical protein CPB83DRAFT_836832 [Crepidotus variabilis]|uniref:MYND-type domain-containing protein n=1 Tax=Crepidotus variabilis TaxID=179855 RepID=A0A9P6EE09_9AGAR|nr:hypothetical protein CPB83DRAFT_836832 [Crepidotus variabilis]